MPKSVSLANSLHHDVLRVRRAADQQWESQRVALFSQALGIVATRPTSDSGSDSDVVVVESKVEWTELLRVANIESVHGEGDATHETRWPFAVESHVEWSDETERGKSGGVVTVAFEAATQNDRDEWVRVLRLAKQLSSTRRLRTKHRRSGHTDAFLRFASSDSEECDSDSVSSEMSEMSVEQFCSLTPMGARQATPVTTAEISVVEPTGKSISVSVPLSRSQLVDKPLHRIKLRALEELKVNVHDAKALSSIGEQAVASFQTILRHEADYFVLHFTSGADIWLKDERQPLSHYIKHGHKVAIISLMLEPQSAMPFPKVQLSISTTKNKVSDLSQKSYTTYVIDVHFNDMNWQVQRRLKEFHKLHHELKEKYPDCELPKLPSKHVFTPLEGQFVNRRRLQLERYTRTLVDHPLLSMDVLFLSFLGVVSTSRDRDLSKNEKSVIHVTALHVGLDYGDIILFSCRFGASVLQRKVTRAKYDHIGIVVPGASRNLLRILEATGEGIQVYSLKARLMAYSREVSNTIVVRRITANRTPEAMQKMLNFVKRVDGNPYSILGILQTRAESERISLASTEASSLTPTETSGSAASSPVGRRSSQLAPSASAGPRPPAPTRRLSTGALLPSPTKDDPDSEQSKRKYFCSSLAAAALKTLGWLETNHTSSYFWPGSFEEGGEIEKFLAPGVCIGKETVVDCRIVEVGLATPIET